MLRVAVGQAYLALGISQLLSVNMPSQSTATVTVMLFLVVAQLCSGVDMIGFKDLHYALLGVPRQTAWCAPFCVILCQTIASQAFPRMHNEGFSYMSRSLGVGIVLRKSSVFGG